jgi:hypothetical protein
MTPKDLFLCVLWRTVSSFPRCKDTTRNQEMDQGLICKVYHDILRNVRKESEHLFNVAQDTGDTELH